MKEAAGKIATAYELARERYAEIGVDAESVLGKLDEIPLSIQ
jgi:L-rhamnose isomerase